MRAPDLAFQGVGVAGFEPTASSSRSNPGGYALIWRSQAGGLSSSPAQAL